MRILGQFNQRDTADLVTVTTDLGISIDIKECNDQNFITTEYNDPLGFMWHKFQELKQARQHK